MPGQFEDDGNCWWVLIQLGLFVVVVDIVADSEEFLVVVRASQKNGSHSNNVVARNQIVVWGFTL